MDAYYLFARDVCLNRYCWSQRHFNSGAFQFRPTEAIFACARGIKTRILTLGATLTFIIKPLDLQPVWLTVHVFGFLCFSLLGGLDDHSLQECWRVDATTAAKYVAFTSSGESLLLFPIVSCFSRLAARTRDSNESCKTWRNREQVSTNMGEYYKFDFIVFTHVTNYNPRSFSPLPRSIWYR